MSKGGLLYAIRAEGTALVKIGYTRGTLDKRVKTLQTGQPFLLSVLATLPVEQDVHQKEALLHKFLKNEHRRGEWFEFEEMPEDLAGLLDRAIQFGAEQESQRQQETTQRDAITPIIGERLRTLRQRQGMSQADLARALGASINAINMIERGQVKAPHIDRLIAMADLFDVSLDYLVGMSDDPRHFREGKRRCHSQAV